MRIERQLEPAYRNLLVERLEEFINNTPIDSQKDLIKRIKNIYFENSPSGYSLKYDQAGLLLEIMGSSLYKFFAKF